MQKVIYSNEIETYYPYIDAKAHSSIRNGHIGSFDSCKNYTLFIFRICDIQQSALSSSQIIIYLDHEDLFVLCERQRDYELACTLFQSSETNERTLWTFFQNLLKNDIDHLEDMECEIADAEMAAMVRFQNSTIRKIVTYRKELLRLKRYYEQLDALFDSLTLNENKMLSEDGIHHFTILARHTTRNLENVRNLRDYVTQMREAYQSQIDIDQNNLMRFFTVITAVFQPLTLMVGWYGMNFSDMPEIDWPYAYPLFIGISLLVCVALLIYFKKKKWF